MKKRLVIIDDHKLIRDTWSYTINHHPDYEVVESFASAEEGIVAIRRLQPSLVLLDINMPGINGLDAITELRHAVPGLKIIGISLHNQPAYARQMLRRGALGYVTKSSSLQEMFEALDTISEGKKFICREVREQAANQLLKGTSGPAGSLTPREKDVVKLLKKGYSSKELGALFNLSAKTVESHRYNILKKLQLKNTAALIQYVNSHPSLLSA